MVQVLMGAFDIRVCSSTTFIFWHHLRVTLLLQAQSGTTSRYKMWGFCTLRNAHSHVCLACTCTCMHMRIYTDTHTSACAHTYIICVYVCLLKPAFCLRHCSASFFSSFCGPKSHLGIWTGSEEGLRIPLRSPATGAYTKPRVLLALKQTDRRGNLEEGTLATGSIIPKGSPAPCTKPRGHLYLEWRLTALCAWATQM